jgi:Flp pilus assembly protein TadG
MRSFSKIDFASSELAPFRKRGMALALKFLQDADSGATLVEFTVVAPVFFLLVFGIIQFGMIFSLQNTMLNAAREASRSMAVQSLTSGQAQTVAVNYLAPYKNTFTYAIRDHCLDSPKVQDVTVTITTSAAAASVINYLNMFTGKNLSASVTMRKELACS